MTNPETTPVITEKERIRYAYDQENLDQTLHSFAFNKPISDDGDGVASERDIDESIKRYASAIAPIAMRNDSPDIRLVKIAFDTLLSGMNAVANEKFGRQQPSSIWQKVMFKTGIQTPNSLIYFSGLENRYWLKQFPAEYREETWVSREDDENETEYLARNIYHSMHGFALAPFSYIQQATHAHGSLLPRLTE
jgi:hypothetical protein